MAPTGTARTGTAPIGTGCRGIDCPGIVSRGTASPGTSSPGTGSPGTSCRGTGCRGTACHGTTCHGIVCPGTRGHRLISVATATDVKSAVPLDLNAGGSLRPVTVLFADIRGFTHLTEVLPAEKLARAI